MPQAVSIGPGQTATITADLTGTTLTWTVGQQITVKVVASGGTFAQTTGYGTAGSGGTGGSSGPTITLGTSSGSAGSPVSLSGSGFADSSTLTVTVGTLSGVTTSPTTITSDTSGAIPSGTTFTIPSGTAAGLYTVTVTDASSNTASQSFQVTATTQYTVTVTQGTNGVIAPGTGSYSAGPSFTITPNANYQIASITVNGNPVTVNTPAGQTYTFTTLTAPADNCDILRCCYSVYCYFTADG